MHWDGVSWSSSKSGTVDDLSDVFGFAANDVWAVGAGTVIHWNGATWAPPAAPFPGTMARHLWGAAPDDLWIQGDTAAYHWNGASFTTSTPTHVASMTRGYGVAGNGGDVVFLAEASAGGAGLFSTTGLLSLAPCMYTEAQTLWGAGGTYFATAIPTPSFTPECPLLRVTSPEFNAAAPIMSQWSAAPRAVGGATANDPWFWNGSKLYRGFGSTTPVAWGSTSATIETVTARAANDVWVTASGGIVSHFDGISWSPQAPAGAASFGRIWSNAPTDAWASNGANVYHWNGATWTDTGSPTTGIVAVIGFGADAAFAATTGYDGAIFEYSGGTWTRALSFPYGVSMWGTSPSNVWGLDGLKGGFAHFDGKAWTTRSVASFGVLFGSQFGSQASWFSENDIWVVNAIDDDVYHWDGTAWRASHTGSTVLSGNPTIAGATASDLWIVSGQGSVFHRGP